MTQSKLTLIHQAFFDVPPKILLDWIEREFNKYDRGKPTLFDRGKSDVGQLKIYIERFSDKTLWIYTHKIIKSRQKLENPSDGQKAIVFEVGEHVGGRSKLSLRYLANSSSIFSLAENVWKQLTRKFEPVSNDFVKEKELQQKYKNVVLLEGVYKVDPVSLEDILQDFLLVQEAQDFKEFGLKIQKEIRSNKHVQFRFVLDYFLNFGYVGEVSALPINDTVTRVKVSYGGAFPFAEYRDEIYKNSAIFFSALVDHLLKLFDQQNFHEHSPQNHFEDRKETQTRDVWFSHKFNCDNRKIKFTYNDLAKKLNLKDARYVGRMYRKWRNELEKNDS